MTVHNPTSTMSEDSVTGQPVADKSHNGAKFVSDGVSGAIKSRKLVPSTTHPGIDIAGANTNARTWTIAENVRKVIVTATGIAATANNEFVDIVMDTNGTIAKAFLEAGHTAHTVGESFMAMRIPMGAPFELPIAPINSPYTRIDVLPSVACNILVEAY